MIRPAVDPETFKLAESRTEDGRGEPDLLRVVNVGWLRWEKGHEYALEAIRRLLDFGVPVRLDVVGGVPGEQRGQLDHRARILHTVADLGLERHVLLHGHASSEEVSRRLRHADALLHASVTEGIPNAIVEAMACQLPVVATRCGGVPEAITDGVEGFLVAPRDPEQLAEALLALWRDPGLRRRMGKAGRERVLSELTLDAEHDAFLSMYREVADAPRPRPRTEPLAPSQAETSPRTGAPETLRVLSAGSVTWQQGLEHSVHALRLLLDMGIGCEYRILGQGDHLVAVAFARHQLGLADHVQLLPLNGRVDLRHEIRTAGVFVDAAVIDAPPDPLLMARAVGTPFVATARPGLPVDGGVAVPRRDARAIAQALATLAGRA